ncbi:MAG: hypothetical protein ABH914_00810 [Candidatus Omnitrophota bacterium]
MKKIVSKPIGDILMNSGLIASEQLNQAVQTQKETGGFLGEILLSSGFIKEEAFAYALSLQFGQDIPFIHLDKHLLAEETIKLIPGDFANRYRIVPVDKFRDILTIATADPENIDEILEKLAKITGMKIEVLLTTTSQLNKAIAKYF